MNNLNPPMLKVHNLVLQVAKLEERIAFLKQQMIIAQGTAIRHLSGPYDPAVLVFNANLKGRIEELESLLKV